MNRVPFYDAYLGLRRTGQSADEAHERSGMPSDSRLFSWLDQVSPRVVAAWRVWEARKHSRSGDRPREITDIMLADLAWTLHSGTREERNNHLMCGTWPQAYIDLEAKILGL